MQIQGVSKIDSIVRERKGRGGGKRERESDRGSNQIKVKMLQKFLSTGVIKVRVMSWQTKEKSAK